jgi:anti-sigma factor RsiW
MQHLTMDELARLVDERASAAEAAHLEGCARCRSELEGLREQTRALGGLPDLAPPAGGWPALRARLRGEALLAERAVPGWRRSLLLAAAALTLFLGGSLTGALATRGPAGAPEGPAAPLAAGAPASVVEAVEELRAAEAAYLATLVRYAELVGDGVEVDPVKRLAALEGIMLTTRAALEESPADPMINGYHLAALGQREAILRQIARRSSDDWF